MEFHPNQKGFQETHNHSKCCYGYPLSQILFKSQEKVENAGKIIYTFKYNKAFTAPVMVVVVLIIPCVKIGHGKFIWQWSGLIIQYLHIFLFTTVTYVMLLDSPYPRMNEI